MQLIIDLRTLPVVVHVVFLLVGASNRNVQAFTSTLPIGVCSTSQQRRQRQITARRFSLPNQKTITAETNPALAAATHREDERHQRPTRSTLRRLRDATNLTPPRPSTPTPRRTVLHSITPLLLLLSPPSSSARTPPPPSGTKKKRACADIDSCRELGDAKIVDDEEKNPTYRLTNGVRYRVLTPADGAGSGAAAAVVGENSVVDVIYSVSTAGGQYMYSQGFGYEKVDVFENGGGGGGKSRSDLGLDSLRVVMGRHDVPVGVEEALVGMRRGERRRVNVPAGVGFESSEWKPEPRTGNGKLAVRSYRRVLEGNGGNQPPFPLSTVWDIEVLGIRK